MLKTGLALQIKIHSLQISIHQSEIYQPYNTQTLIFNLYRFTIAKVKVIKNTLCLDLMTILVLQMLR